MMRWKWEVLAHAKTEPCAMNSQTCAGQAARRENNFTLNRSVCVRMNHHTITHAVDV